MGKTKFIYKGFLIRKIKENKYAPEKLYVVIWGEHLPCFETLDDAKRFINQGIAERS